MEKMGKLGSRWTSRPGAQSRWPREVSCEPSQKGQQDKDTQGQGQVMRTTVWLELGHTALLVPDVALPTRTQGQQQWRMPYSLSLQQGFSAGSGRGRL